MWKHGETAGRGATAAALDTPCPSALWFGALTIVPALLFAPILYYSLDSPFHLIDDYWHWRYVHLFDSPYSPSSFLHLVAWIEWVVGIDEVGPRYRPAFQIYMGLVWKWFGANASMHHLFRWMLHFGSVALFCAAFLRICAMPRGRIARTVTKTNKRKFRYLLPLVVMVHVWLFFPNTPQTRLIVPEVPTVFFLGLCNYVAAVALSWELQRRRSPTKSLKTPWHLLYGLFLFGFLGLSFLKETNVALSLVFLVGYFVFVFPMMKAGWRAALAGVPLIAAMVLTVVRVYAATENFGVGYGGAYSVYRSMVNAAKVLVGLFQVQTSAVVTVGFVVLLVALALGMAGSLRAPEGKRSQEGGGGALARLGRAMAVDYELAFVLFLTGQFACLFLILAASWGVVLRYWYPLVPLLSMLLAFGAKFVLEAAGRGDWPVRRVALPLVAFVVFHVACNYHNFSMQTTTWHGMTNAVDGLIEEVRRLGDRGEHVVVEGTGRQQECNLARDVGDFFAHFHGKDFAVHAEPPDAGRPYYFVTRKELPDHERATTIVGRREYRFLEATSSVAALLQLRREPFEQLDAGDAWYQPYVWNIYRVAAFDSRDAVPAMPPKKCRYQPFRPGPRRLRDSNAPAPSITIEQRAAI